MATEGSEKKIRDLSTYLAKFAESHIRERVGGSKIKGPVFPDNFYQVRSDEPTVLSVDSNYSLTFEDIGKSIRIKVDNNAGGYAKLRKALESRAFAIPNKYSGVLKEVRLEKEEGLSLVLDFVGKNNSQGRHQNRDVVSIAVYKAGVAPLLEEIVSLGK